VQAVGGLNVDQAIQTVELGAQSVVFGAPLVISGTEFKPADPNLEGILRDLVWRVKNTTIGSKK
jgi:hypothetical protein